MADLLALVWLAVGIGFVLSALIVGWFGDFGR
jgi:hypothetical protein